ncbi:MAG: N-6 DNA methylase [Rhodocyclaceae bacterium]|nr:N-6 DNA methylase [Rhodocyclaceae bacterium]
MSRTMQMTRRSPRFTKSFGVGVPLAYRKTRGLLQLFRCAHKPDFIVDGKLVCNPVHELAIATSIEVSDPWWDAEQIRNGSLWDNKAVCEELLDIKNSAHKRLFDAIKALSKTLTDEEILPKHLRRKLLILSLLIAYLEQRQVFKEGYFAEFMPGATKFFQVLADGKALLTLLEDLEQRFNGNVFTLTDSDKDRLRNNRQLSRFSRLIEGHEDLGGQLTLWQLYSFKDLPVELISHVYQLFVKDASSSVYTPPFLVRLIVEEVLSWERIDDLIRRDEIVLDPSCGSGVFLVEAYKRLVLHWRSRNQWRKPSVKELRKLLQRVHGVDLEAGAIELAAFSLCLALCDALEPEEIRATIKLFPALEGNTLHKSCFFDARERSLIHGAVGVCVETRPSSLNCVQTVRSVFYEKYIATGLKVPDKQVAYLFLEEAMRILAPGGVLGMLQQYNFLYNQNTKEFRHSFISKWDVREILRFPFLFEDCSKTTLTPRW